MSLLIYAHILLLVFWVGADIGVFVAGLFFRDPKRSIEARKTVIEAGLVVDALPRLCFVLMGPVGFQLATNVGLFQPPPGLTAAVWIGGLIWATCALVGILKPGTTVAKFDAQGRTGVPDRRDRRFRRRRPVVAHRRRAR